MIKCAFEDGHEVQLRHIVVDAIVLRENEILLVKRAPHLSNGGKYGLIGGFMDRDENLETTLKREVLEETGYKVGKPQLIFIIDNPNRKNEDRQNVVFAYVVEALEKVGEADDESTEVRWFDFDNLPKEDEFAFDHYEQIQLYLKHKNNLPKFPIFISS